MDFSEDQSITIRWTDGQERPIYLWGSDQPKAVLLCIHGGLAHGRDFVTVGDYFRNLGFLTVSYDQSGHHLKKKIFIPGYEVFLNDLDQCLTWIRQRYPDTPIFLVGHSMGGLILGSYGLKNENIDQVHGFVLSSPFFRNVIPVNGGLKAMAGFLSRLFPRLKVPMDSFTHVLSHDQEITRRHFENEKSAIRGSEVSARFGHSLMLAQEALAADFSDWSHPALVFVAGQDYLADSAATKNLCQQHPTLIEVQEYPDNYHENFNETNRQDVFLRMYEWFNERLAKL